MKYFLIAICIFYSLACTSQTKNIYGIYFSHYSYYGEANSILRLDSNNTFHYYENLDEGDVASECLSSGMFSIVGDSLFFESLYDSSYNVGYTKNIYFVNFADTKMRISNSGLQASNLPKIARPNAEMRSFYKLDFLELDSIKIRAFTISTIEDLLITKNNVASLSSTKIDGIKTFYIANTKYQHLLSRLQKINLFSLTHKNIVDGAVVAGSVELFMGKNHIYVSGNYFSQELYDLLFREVLAD